MNDNDFIKELERRWNVNESIFLDGKIALKKYEDNKAFFKKIAQTIERNRELEFDHIPDLMTENFIKSLIRELKEFGLMAVFTQNNEVRIVKEDLTAYNN